MQNPDGSTHINLWYRLTTAFAEQELMEYAAVPQHRSAVWYPSVGIYAARQGSWVLGAKFGSNGDSHNHNDTGSITVYKDGRPFLIDIGVESYTKKTFSPQRYEIWTMQSAWHNLPTFDGVQQLPGAEYAAREVCTEENSITGELAGAYPPIPGLTTYRRSVSVSEQGITLRDETDYPGTVDLTLLTEQQPVPTADGFAVGTLGGIRFDPDAATAAVTAVPITDPRLRTAWPETIYKITLHFRKNAEARTVLRRTAMETIKLKILDEAGHTLMTCDADTAVSLVYTNCYKPGDRVALEIDHPGQYCVIQFEDTMPEALVYVVKREINFHIPFGEQAITYSPKSFAGSRHVIRARLALPEEIAARRNLAFNCYDEHGDTGFYPHASANVETRGEAVFAARNAIDGIFENSAHGEYPYQSWGINRDPNAALTLDFWPGKYCWMSCASPSGQISPTTTTG